MRTTMIVSSFLLLTACASTPEVAPDTKPAGDAAASSERAAPAASSEPAAAAPAQALGDAIPADAVPVKVGDIARDPAAWNGKRVTIEGVVTKMCKKKGCWFEVTDGAGSKGVLITASRYHIFLNQGSEGKTIVAHGEFKTEVQDLEEARHLAKDAGEPEPTEAPVVLRIVADGVQFR